MDAELSQRLTHLLERLDHWLPPAAEPVNWQTEVAALWQRHPLGGRLVAVPPRDALALDDLLGIERQKQALVDNTRAFLQGLPANHALLWGARGSGKSSVVRALLNALAGEGLRLVQIDRHELASLPVLVEQLRHQPQRFVVYCDDLSFEGNDDAYKALKSVLDGALTGPPDNVLLYATSNRRHLLPESMDDNSGSQLVGEELHHGDAVEEKISLSDRFGLWLSFHPFNQATYLDLCAHWVSRVSDENVSWDDEARAEALRFATLRGGRSGRTAWQFAAHWVGRKGLHDKA